jgi:hypothetical protein
MDLFDEMLYNIIHELIEELIFDEWKTIVE